MKDALQDLKDEIGDLSDEDIFDLRDWLDALAQSIEEDSNREGY